MIPVDEKGKAMEEFMLDYTIFISNSRDMSLPEWERTLSRKKALAMAAAITTLDGSLNAIGERRDVPVAFVDLPFEGYMTPCIQISPLELVEMAQKCADETSSAMDTVNIVSFRGETTAFVIKPMSVGNVVAYTKKN